MTRRSALRLSGTALLGSLAGCSMLPSTGTQGLALGDVVVTHSSTRRHILLLKLERDGELVREATYDFSGTEKRIVQSSWPRDPAAYTLYTIVQGPLSGEDGELNLYVNEFTSGDAASDAKECSVVHVKISAPDPGVVGVGTAAPRPKWGDCGGK